MGKLRPRQKQKKFLPSGLPMQLAVRSGRSLLGRSGAQPPGQKRVHGFCAAPPPSRLEPLADAWGGIPALSICDFLTEPGSRAEGDKSIEAEPCGDDVQAKKKWREVFAASKI